MLTVNSLVSLKDSVRYFFSLRHFIFHIALRSNNMSVSLASKLLYLADTKSAELNGVMEDCLAFGK